MSDRAPRTRTGKARMELAQALRADFQDVRSALSDAIELAEALASESGGVNGVASWWRGVAQKLGHERAGLEQKIEEVVTTLTSDKAPPSAPEASVDEGHLERVREARAERVA
jgi:hypothetical protein